MSELAELGLVNEATVTVRVHDLTPLFKLFLLNDEEMFFGLYPITERTVQLDGEPVPIYDLGGKDAVLFHYSATEDADATGTQNLRQSRDWYDGIWNTMAREHTP